MEHVMRDEVSAPLSNLRDNVDLLLRERSPVAGLVRDVEDLRGLVGRLAESVVQPVQRNLVQSPEEELPLANIVQERLNQIDGELQRMVERDIQVRGLIESLKSIIYENFAATWKSLLERDGHANGL
jgi:hypothetical protein